MKLKIGCDLGVSYPTKQWTIDWSRWDSGKADPLCGKIADVRVLKEVRDHKEVRGQEEVRVHRQVTNHGQCFGSGCITSIMSRRDADDKTRTPAGPAQGSFSSEISESLQESGGDTESEFDSDTLSFHHDTELFMFKDSTVSEKVTFQPSWCSTPDEKHVVSLQGAASVAPSPKCRSAPPVLENTKICSNLTQVFQSSCPEQSFMCNAVQVSSDDRQSNSLPLVDESSFDGNSVLVMDVDHSQDLFDDAGFPNIGTEDLREVGSVPGEQTSCIPGYCPLIGCSSTTTVLSEGPICRICHEGDHGEGGMLFKPCKCSGTHSYAHQKCLERWLQMKNEDLCELCMYEFQTKRKYRPFQEWLQQPSHPRDRRNIVMDLMCFCLLTPMVFSSAWLCLHGARYYITNFKQRELEGFGLIILATVLLLIFLFWTAVSLRYHCSIWNHWRNENQLVHILVEKPPSTPELCSSHASPSCRSCSTVNSKYISSEDDRVEGTLV